MEFLLQGISEFDLQNGVEASEVLAHGPLAFPIGTTEDGRAFLAGAYYGKGRVVVITEEGLLRREVGCELVNVIGGCIEQSVRISFLNLKRLAKKHNECRCFHGGKGWGVTE